MNYSSHIIRERSKLIPIKKNLSTDLEEIKVKGEYSLKQNFFDPSKSSPPNEFMIKLYMRMSIYNNQVDMKDDSLDNE